MILAAIDIGTNSVRLLVAREVSGRMMPLVRKLTTTRLGAGLVNSGLLSPPGKVATQAAVSCFLDVAAKMGAERTVVFATSAMREAGDGAGFARQLAAECKTTVDILPFGQEAAYSYTGVVRSLPQLQDAAVFDLGGGSCELICRSGGQLTYSSKKIGAVYLTDSFFHSDPPQPLEVAQAREFVCREIADWSCWDRPLVGVGGTVTSLAALEMGLPHYDSERVHGYRLSSDAVAALLERMLVEPLTERIKMPGMQEERAAILPAGTLVVEALLQRSSSSSLTVSEGDILLGCLYHLSGLA